MAGGWAFESSIGFELGDLQLLSGLAAGLCPHDAGVGTGNGTGSGGERGGAGILMVALNGIC